MTYHQLIYSPGPVKCNDRVIFVLPGPITLSILGFHLLIYLATALTVQFRNFRICLCLEIGSKPQEAIPYCQEAISVCKARLQRLIKEVKSSTESATSSAVSELDEGVQQSSNVQADKSVTDKEAEIETLSGLSAELEKKVRAATLCASVRISFKPSRVKLCICICSLKIYNSWS